ncbi:unnamed protein product [Dicrocoelium dendriticum]|nr:unnamed protein product [Dicrocoelium dendriticum]CAH8584510.1 unnamed protein product [Dicrocoelium dendriticum]
MDVWRQLFVSEDIIRALEKASFHEPTAIQSCTLPCAIRDRQDILGAAPTGSGKTLAYGVPLLMHVRDRKQYALQINDNLRTIATGAHVFSAVAPDRSEFTPSLHTLTKRRKTERDKVSKDPYLNLALVEELDIETGEVLSVQSLLGHSGLHSPGKENVSHAPKQSTKCSPTPDSHVYGLVLVPTRELALQVRAHLRSLAEFMQPRPTVEAIVGGLSIQKQQRLLRYRPDIIVATPGRLWQLIQQQEPHLCSIPSCGFLVVDEADKLVEANHFEELRQLCSWINTASDPDKVTSVSNPKQIKQNRQTLVFSATLTFVHHHALCPGLGKKGRKLAINGRNRLTPALKLGALRKLLGLNKRAKVFDLSLAQTPDNASISILSDVPVLPGRLHEYRLMCPDQPSKDVRLFWFLAFGRYTVSENIPTTDSQRCLIFLNSKSGVRRLAGVLRQLLKADTFSVSGHPSVRFVNVLHSDMLQKQRLRALDRFQADSNSILIASDVASRGLDLAAVDASCGGVAWVVHFDVPRTAEVYVHRSGRTARAHRAGTSVLFECPNEFSLWKRVAFSLKRTEMDLPDLPVVPSYFELVASDRIVTMARQLDHIEHSVNRRAANEDWFAHAAKNADIELDSDFERHASDDEIRRDYVPSMLSKRRQVQKQCVKARCSLMQLVAECRKSLQKKSTRPAPSPCTLHNFRKKLKKLNKHSASRLPQLR